MIDCFLGDAFGILSCPFWSGVLSVVLGCRYNLKLPNRVVSGVRFFTGGVFGCDIAYRRSLAVLCILYKIRCNPMHPLYGAYLGPMCQWGLHAVVWSHISILMRLLVAQPCSTAGLLFFCQYLCGTIIVTPYSMVWDWLVSRAGPMPFYWPSCSLLFCLLLFSLSLLSFYGLILLSWGLRIVGLGSSEDVNSSLPALHCQSFLILIIIIIIMKFIKILKKRFIYKIDAFLSYFTLCNN